MHRSAYIPPNGRCQIFASMLAGSSPGRTAQAADVSVDGAVGIPGGPCHASSALVAWQASAALVAWQARCSTFRASAVCRVWVWPPWCRCPSLDVYDSLVEPRPPTTSACCSHSTRTRPQAYSVIAEIASPTEPTFLAATGVPNERSRRLQIFSSMETNCSIFASVMVVVCGCGCDACCGVGDSPSTAPAAWCADAHTPARAISAFRPPSPCQRVEKAPHNRDSCAVKRYCETTFRLNLKLELELELKSPRKRRPHRLQEPRLDVPDPQHTQVEAKYTPPFRAALKRPSRCGPCRSCCAEAPARPHARHPRHQAGRREPASMGFDLAPHQ